jgi:hypothetical protein
MSSVLTSSVPQVEGLSSKRGGDFTPTNWKQILRLPALQVTAAAIACSLNSAVVASSVKLKWDASPTASSDAVGVPPTQGTNVVWQGSAQTPGVWPVRHELPRDAVGVNISGLQPGATYNFVVQYGNPSGWSDFSNMVSTQIPAGPPVTGPVMAVPVLRAPPVVIPPTTSTGGTELTVPPTTTPTDPSPDTSPPPPATETTEVIPKLIIKAQNGGAIVQVLGNVGQHIVVHLCTDLIAQDWVLKADVTLGVDGQFSFTSNDNVDGEVKFFRAMVVP